LRLAKDASEQEWVSNHHFWNHFLADLLSNVTVNGVPGIERALVSQRTTGVFGNMNVTKEYIIETEGINLRGVMKKDVDASRVYCNDPHEMLSVFGIEIARESLLNEIRGVIEDAGSAINYRHLVLLVEVMTHRGGIMSITRHGINRTDAGPLMKCTFEQTVDILLDAAVHGERMGFVELQRTSLWIFCWTTLVSFISRVFLNVIVRTALSILVTLKSNQMSDSSIYLKIHNNDEPK
ncbi:DNA-directed RNA polymerase II subunit rpb1, partial [Chytriomyces hyalinus]